MRRITDEGASDQEDEGATYHGRTPTNHVSPLSAGSSLTSPASVHVRSEVSDDQLEAMVNAYHPGRADDDAALGGRRWHTPQLGLVVDQSPWIGGGEEEWRQLRGSRGTQETEEGSSTLHDSDLLMDDDQETFHSNVHPIPYESSPTFMDDLAQARAGDGGGGG